VRNRLVALGAVAAATAVVGLADPQGGGPYPRCPSKLILGIDCPGCGGLRGTHDLLHGHVLQALDHNLLLPFTLGLMAFALGRWLLPLVGRPARPLHPPRWAIAASMVVVVTFTVLRNLPVPALAWLGSS
jgi:uncharacterized protein DUF2752